MKKLQLITLEIAIAIALTACSRQSPEQHFQFAGTVMSVEADARQVTVNHNAIPGFMDAMTMPYIVKDDVELAKLKPGDQFTADLVVDRENGRAWLDHIQVTKAGNGARPL